jgi:hypothetical protein
VDAIPQQPERTGMLGREELNRRLGYHPATADTIPHYEETRARVLELACHWDETLPPGRELAEAQTCLQGAAMWANAAVACNLAPLADPAGRRPNPLVQQMTQDQGTRTLTVGIACPEGMGPAQLADAVRDEVLFRLEHRSGTER